MQILTCKSRINFGGLLYTGKQIGRYTRCYPLIMANCPYNVSKEVFKVVFFRLVIKFSCTCIVPIITIPCVRACAIEKCPLTEV